ncbi:MAG: hypothetical protein J2O48_07850 [Solirubrobacterales bacterium]|nr:hypothetical protein [Solirubrobacterales bacterium]
MPQDHWWALRQHKGLSARQKWLWGAGAVLLIAVLVLAIALAGGSSARRGCFTANLPGAMGAETVHQCGAEARQTCSTVRQSPRYPPVVVALIRDACRAGGLKTPAWPRG